MKMMLMFLMLLSSVAQAGPYFRVKPFQKVDSGAFFKIGTPVENVTIGMTTPVIWHSSQDGFWLIEGVDWDLLDLGWTIPVDGNSLSLVLGPSVKLDEPIKKALRGVIGLLPGAIGSWDALRALTAPGGSGYLSAGPAWSLDTGNWRGSLVLAATLSKRF